MELCVGPVAFAASSCPTRNSLYETGLIAAYRTLPEGYSPVPCPAPVPEPIAVSAAATVDLRGVEAAPLAVPERNPLGFFLSFAVVVTLGVGASIAFAFIAAGEASSPRRDLSRHVTWPLVVGPVLFVVSGLNFSQWSSEVASEVSSLLGLARFWFLALLGHAVAFSGRLPSRHQAILFVFLFGMLVAASPLLMAIGAYAQAPTGNLFEFTYIYVSEMFYSGYFASGSTSQKIAELLSYLSIDAIFLSMFIVLMNVVPNIIGWVLANVLPVELALPTTYGLNVAFWTSLVMLGRPVARWLGDLGARAVARWARS